MKPHSTILAVPLTNRPLFFVLFCCLFFAFNNCKTKNKQPQAAVPEVKETKTGLASYYGYGLEGKETASGETFDSKEMVAAHPTYPLGTVARVTNLQNDSSVEVRITDRGPTKVNRNEGVIIDLSKGAAKKIGMVAEGRVKVRVDVLEWGKDSTTSDSSGSK